jgi:hypothetical protein
MLLCDRGAHRLRPYRAYEFLAPIATARHLYEIRPISFMAYKYLSALVSLDSLRRSLQSWRDAARAAATSGDRITVLDAAQAVDLDRLDDDLRLAPVPTPELFRKIIEHTETRVSSRWRSEEATRVDSLIDAGSWTEAAFAIIEIETPNWMLRRLIYEDGEWICSLSRQRHLPVVLDDMVEAGHAALLLAVLRAVVEVRRGRPAIGETTSPVPQIQAMSEQTICCDNFA